MTDWNKQPPRIRGDVGDKPKPQRDTAAPTELIYQREEARLEGRDETRAVVESILAEVDLLVEAGDPDALIEIDQSTAIRVLLRHTLNDPASALRKIKADAWDEGYSTCLGDFDIAARREARSPNPYTGGAS